MRRLVALPALLALCAMAGCVESKNPPYRAEDLVFEPALLGDWDRLDFHCDDPEVPVLPDPEKETVHKVVPAKGTGYRRIIVTGGKKEAAEDFHLFKLGDHYFACAFHETQYSISKVTVSGNRLTFWEMDASSVLATRPEAAKHEWEGEGEARSVVLTGKDDDVRAFLTAHANDPGVWRPGQTFVRRGELKVGASGLTGKKQRSLDYWFTVRATLQSARVPLSGSGADAAREWDKVARLIRKLPTDGVDPDAVATGPLAEAFCTEMAKYTGKRRRPDDPFAAMVRGTLGGAAIDPAILPPGSEQVEKRFREVAEKLETARKKLADRYGCEFPPIR